jgi:hypothetical protein
MSALIGALVGLPVIIIIHHNIDIFSLIESSIAGMTIGLISRIMFITVYKNMQKNPLISFFLVGIIIFIGTFIFSYAFGVRNFLYIFLMIFFAELIGIAMTFFYFQYLKKINNKLKEFQNRQIE